MFGSFLPSLWSSDNQSLLGSRSRHSYAIKFLWRIRKELHGKKEKLLIDPAINDLIHRSQVIGKLGSLSFSGGHAE